MNGKAKGPERVVAYLKCVTKYEHLWDQSDGLVKDPDDVVELPSCLTQEDEEHLANRQHVGVYWPEREDAGWALSALAQDGNSDNSRPKILRILIHFS